MKFRNINIAYVVRELEKHLPIKFKYRYAVDYVPGWMGKEDELIDAGVDTNELSIRVYSDYISVYNKVDNYSCVWERSDYFDSNTTAMIKSVLKHKDEFITTRLKREHKINQLL